MSPGAGRESGPECSTKGCGYLALYAPRVLFFAPRERDPDGEKPIVMHAELPLCDGCSKRFKLADLAIGTTLVDMMTAITASVRVVEPDFSRTRVERCRLDSKEYIEFAASLEHQKRGGASVQ